MRDECAVIDRFEGETAVCITENRRVFTLPKHALPPSAREGFHICRENGVWRLEERETEKGRDALKKRMDALWK